MVFAFCCRHLVPPMTRRFSSLLSAVCCHISISISRARRLQASLLYSCCPTNRTMGLSTALFLTLPDENLVCSICHDVFADPTSCRCGHTFCAACLEQAQKRATDCPICRSKISKKDIFSNMALWSMIGNLHIRCKALSESNKRCRLDENGEAATTPRGCDWTGKVSEYDSHIL